MKVNFIEDEYLKAWIEDDIIYGEYAYNLEMTLTIAMETVKIRRNLAGEKPYPIIIDLHNLRSITKEARDFLAKGKAVESVIAIALISRTNLHKMIGNLYLTFSKPPVPTRLFNDKTEARVWIKQFTSNTLNGSRR
jgi:hypothetical protein